MDRLTQRSVLLITIAAIGCCQPSFADEHSHNAFESHQAAVHALEAQGFDMVYESGDHAAAEVQVPAFSDSSAYVRNALARRVEVPIVRVRSHLSFGGSCIDFGAVHPSTIDLSPIQYLSEVRELDLSWAPVSDDNLIQLGTLPELRLLVLSEEFLSDERRAKLENMLPGCEVSTRRLNFWR